VEFQSRLCGIVRVLDTLEPQGFNQISTQRRKDAKTQEKEWDARKMMGKRKVEDVQPKLLPVDFRSPLAAIA